MDDRREGKREAEGGSGDGRVRRGGKPRLTPLDNWAFQKIFGSKGSEGATRALANAVLEAVGIDRIDEIDSIAADTSLPNAVDLRSPRLDVLLFSGERAVDLEAQLYELDVESKLLYYCSCLLAGRVEKGGDPHYRDIPQTAAIAFLQGWMMFPNSEQFVTAGRFHWELEEGCQPGNDRIVFAVCELDKVAQRYNGVSEDVLADELTAWLYVLAKGYRDEQEVDAIMEKILSVEEFSQRYGLAMGDPDAWEAYDRHVKWVLEQNSIVDAAEQRGLKRGEERGLKIGIARGEALGEARGMATATARYVRRLMESLDMTAGEAMGALGLDSAEREQLKELQGESSAS